MFRVSKVLKVKEEPGVTKVHRAKKVIMESKVHKEHKVESVTWSSGSTRSPG